LLADESFPSLSNYIWEARYLREIPSSAFPNGVHSHPIGGEQG
jgi:hypothetical protein